MTKNARNFLKQGTDRCFMSEVPPVRCLHNYTDAGRRHYAMWPRKKKILNFVRAIMKFAGDVQIAEIVRCQFYLWP